MGQELCLEIDNIYLPEFLRKSLCGVKPRGKCPLVQDIEIMIDQMTYLECTELNFQKLSFLRPCTFKVELGQNKVIDACLAKIELQ